jgi:hypothetical protein
MWLGHDQFHYLWKRLTGDLILSASVRFLGEGVERHRKLGWIVRSGLGPASRHGNASLHGDGLMSLQFKENDGETTGKSQSAVRGADVI